MPSPDSILLDVTVPRLKGVPGTIIRSFLGVSDLATLFEEARVGTSQWPQVTPSTPHSGSNSNRETKWAAPRSRGPSRWATTTASSA